MGDQQQHAVGIAVRQSGRGRVGVFVERVRHFMIQSNQFLDLRNGLQADRTERIVGIDQGGVVGRDAEPKELFRPLGSVLLAAGQGKAGVQLGGSRYPVPKLPLPIVPLIVGGAGPNRKLDTKPRLGQHSGSPSCAQKSGDRSCQRVRPAGLAAFSKDISP